MPRLPAGALSLAAHGGASQRALLQITIQDLLGFNFYGGIYEEFQRELPNSSFGELQIFQSKISRVE